MALSNGEIKGSLLKWPFKKMRASLRGTNKERYSASGQKWQGAATSTLQPEKDKREQLPTCWENIWRKSMPGPVAFSRALQTNPQQLGRDRASRPSSAKLIQKPEIKATHLVL